MRIKWPRTSYEARQLKKQNHRRLMDMLEVRGAVVSCGRCLMAVAIRTVLWFQTYKDRVDHFQPVLTPLSYPQGSDVHIRNTINFRELVLSMVGTLVKVLNPSVRPVTTALLR
jgi:hypothetical protein